MDPICPIEARKLAHAVMAAAAATDPLAPPVLRSLAVAAAEAGLVDRVLVLLAERDGVRLVDPAASPDELLVKLGRPVDPSVLPKEPVCISGGSGDLAGALEACGLPTVTVLPLWSRDILIGALVLGHPPDHTSVQVAKEDIDLLKTIGAHLGTAIALRRAAPLSERSPGYLPDAGALRSIAMTGRLASLGTVAGGLVHEVNNPATFIALAGGQIEKFVTRALAQGGCEGLEPVLELATGIRESTDQIRDMVAAFRLLVGVTHRSVVVTVDLERVLKAAVELTRAAHRHDAVLEIELEQMPSCPGHYVELGTALVNVLVNAIESLRAASSPNKVRVEGRVQDDEIRIRVRDTGEGIAKERLEQVFDPFFTTRDRSQHAGLGLTIAREAVVGLEGRIALESQVGVGTTVRIDVPVREGGG